ncbi:hypothetical protein AA0113_g10116 [Alternaria arborescens]|uniref:Uncharacterized protein n=1 Tax=Alternaria arborescens TaxID=156630 RepID=A0A4Q4QWH7_9PLEO|nr:hypothetical protein AA0112_g8895 [Alternaria arborescens]RYO48075.1 hypothetical protein AA0113_g10116 [Alternaria arborescens]
MKRQGYPTISVVELLTTLNDAVTNSASQCQAAIGSVPKADANITDWLSNALWHIKSKNLGILEVQDEPTAVRILQSTSIRSVLPRLQNRQSTPSDAQCSANQAN